MFTLFDFYQEDFLSNKLFLDFSTLFNSLHSLFYVNLINLISFVLSKDVFLSYVSLSQQPLNISFIYSLKFSISILFLIFIRAGVPRYRYDYLTKIGWSKFTVFCLFVFVFEYLLFTLL